MIFMNCLVTDTGAGGVWIGDQMEDTQIVATSSKIISNEISYSGNVFPCAVGILVLRASNIIVGDNVVHHHRYDGIAIDFQNGYNPKWWTTRIFVLGNYVHIILDNILFMIHFKETIILRFVSNPNIIALFAGDVNQCDFFTVQSNSPAAKLGFVNTTKPSKWTPGCDVDYSHTKNFFFITHTTIYRRKMSSSWIIL